MSIFFNGRLLVTPTVESAIYDQGLATVFPGRAGNVLAILGTSEGGVPDEVQVFDSPVTARRKLRGGELLKAVEKAFSPSAESGSPARVATVRVEKAVQSQITLKDASTNNVILLKSADYGGHTANIKVTIESGTSVGKRITVQEGTDTYTKNNIAKTPFTVKYTGAQATATAEVTATQLKLAAPAGSVVATLDLVNYTSVRGLCDAINAVSGFSTVVSNPTDPVVTSLDGMTPTSCKTVDLAVKADLQACIDWFNLTGVREMVYASRVAGALAPPTNLAATYLTGGSNGAAPTNNDWQDAFDALQSADVQWVVPLSSASAIWGMADAHVQFMSGPGKSERRAFVGDGIVAGSVSTAISTVTGQALAINSDRTAICFPSPLEPDDVGNLSAIPAYYLAAQVAGGFAAMNPGNTMTNKILKVSGMSPLIANPVDTDTLITNGVLTLRKSRRGFVVAKAVPTWLANQNYNRVEISTGAALDYVARSVREALEIFIGRKASPITLYEAIETTESVLSELARPEPVGLGVIVGDTASPAYRGITAEIEGDILRVWFECSPVIPINYVLVGIYAKAYSGTASAVATA